MGVGGVNRAKVSVALSVAGVVVVDWLRQRNTLHPSVNRTNAEGVAIGSGRDRRADLRI